MASLKMPVPVQEVLRALCTLLPVDAPPRPLLPPGVLAVLQLIGPRGLTEREAAEILNYSYRHTRRLAAEACELLGAKNTRQAIYRATKSGLLS